MGAAGVETGLRAPPQLGLKQVKYGPFLRANTGWLFIDCGGDARSSRHRRRQATAVPTLAPAAPHLPNRCPSRVRLQSRAVAVGFPASGGDTSADSAACCTLRPESARNRGKSAANSWSELAAVDATSASLVGSGSQAVSRPLKLIAAATPRFMPSRPDGS
jgi:hypothetical protein